MVSGFTVVTVMPNCSTTAVGNAGIDLSWAGKLSNVDRVSVIDMYPHCRARFKECGLPLVYSEMGFTF